MSATINAIPSVDEIFAQVVRDYPDLPLKLASGALEDVGKISDVDISLLYDPIRASALFTSIIGTKHKPTHSIYTLGGYVREVNVFTTLDAVLAQRAVIHRENELYINTKWPQIANAAREYKLMGIPTERAYGAVIGFGDTDPYTALLNRSVIDTAVARHEKNMIDNLLC